MQLQKLVKKIEFPRIDVVEHENILVVIFNHSAEKAGIFAKELPLYFVLLAIFGANSSNDPFLSFRLHCDRMNDNNNILTGKNCFSIEKLIISYEFFINCNCFIVHARSYISSYYSESISLKPMYSFIYLISN